MKVGWYVHHHGSGHRTRAMLVGRRLATHGVDVTLLGSGLDLAATRAAGLESVPLPHDAPLADGASASDADVTMRGLMHWAPLGHRGFSERMTTIARWIQVHEPDVVVVDVSCEVTVLVRLLGVPVIVVAQPGLRHDAPHHSALAAATAVLAPWPEWAHTQLWSTGTSAARVVAVGGLARSPRAAIASAGRHRTNAWDGVRRATGLILSGSEGFDRADLPMTIVRSAPHLDWQVAGGDVWVPDVRSLIARADVVVTHGGQNAVADVAAAGVAALVVPQRRPYEEQDHMAATLDAAGLATAVRPEDLDTIDWACALDTALARGGRGWVRWECAGAVDRAAALVEAVAGG